MHLHKCTCTHSQFGHGSQKNTVQALP
jgi:hypothetical protein